jgi:MarR family transcriptional regulator for hemolysin
MRHANVAAIQSNHEGLLFGFLLQEVSFSYSNLLKRRAGHVPLTLSQCQVLFCLKNNAGITQARLAGLTDTDPATLVRVLDQLESEGFCKRMRDRTDRRCYRLYLTSQAEPLLEQVRRTIELTIDAAFERVSPEARSAFLDVLQRIQTNLSCCNFAASAG